MGEWGGVFEDNKETFGTYLSHSRCDQFINVEYQLMTGTVGGHALTKEPVYIISFMSNKGNSVPAGPIGNEKVYIHHEFNTIVDANNGETLFGLEYR